jgi:uncharacterized protein (DUF58 family)
VENFQKYLDPVTLAKIEGLDLKARLVVEGYIAGLHKSPYHGFSVEFAEHREYAPGDDIKHVDWKLWGRTDKLYLKQYEEETNLITYLLLDASESMRYHSGDVSKFDYARYIAAALAYLVLRQQDSVGLATYDDQVRQFIRPSSHPSHLNQILHLMDVSMPERRTDVSGIFHDLAERFKKRGLVVILSDLFDDVSSLLSGLKHFRHRRHEVVLFQVLDAAELDFPFEDTTLFKGLEEMPAVLSEPRALRHAYQQEFAGFLTEVRRGCRAHQVDHVLLRTDQRLDVALSAYLSARRTKRR